MHLTVSLNTLTYFDERFQEGDFFETSLFFAPAYKQPIDGKPQRHTNFPVKRVRFTGQKQKRIESCKALGANFYTIAGQVVSNTHKVINERTIRSTYLDCGVPVKLSRPWSERNHDNEDDFAEGNWVAAAGWVHLSFPEPMVYPIRARLESLFVIDLDLDSETFGTYLPLKLGDPLVLDPDVVAFPAVIATILIP